LFGGGKKKEKYRVLNGVGVFDLRKGEKFALV